jgi:anti-anti-sigma regulatory factor
LIGRSDLVKGVHPMKLALHAGWEVDVERGPDWLFVRPHPPQGNYFEDPSNLAQQLWDLMEQGFQNRLVVELNDLVILPSEVIGQLMILHKRVAASGGIMRICGLSRQCEEVLRINRLADRLYPYRDRAEAIMGQYPLTVRPR